MKKFIQFTYLHWLIHDKIYWCGSFCLTAVCNSFYFQASFKNFLLLKCIQKISPSLDTPNNCQLWASLIVWSIYDYPQSLCCLFLFMVSIHDEITSHNRQCFTLLSPCVYQCLHLHRSCYLELYKLNALTYTFHWIHNIQQCSVVKIYIPKIVLTKFESIQKGITA